MKKSKKLFLILAIIFLGIIIYISIDIASRTTFPGSKSNLKERIAPRDTKESDPKNNSQDSSNQSIDANN